MPKQLFHLVYHSWPKEVKGDPKEWIESRVRFEGRFALIQFAKALLRLRKYSRMYSKTNFRLSRFEKIR